MRRSTFVKEGKFHHGIKPCAYHNDDIDKFGFANLFSWSVAHGAAHVLVSQGSGEVHAADSRFADSGV